jgi:hypothetical protein
VDQEKAPGLPQLDYQVLQVRCPILDQFLLWHHLSGIFLKTGVEGPGDEKGGGKKGGKNRHAGDISRQTELQWGKWIRHAHHEAWPRRAYLGMKSRSRDSVRGKKRDASWSANGSPSPRLDEYGKHGDRLSSRRRYKMCKSDGTFWCGECCRDE